MNTDSTTSIVPHCFVTPAQSAYPLNFVCLAKQSNPKLRPDERISVSQWNKPRNCIILFNCWNIVQLNKSVTTFLSPSTGK